MNVTISRESSQFGELLKLKVWGNTSLGTGASPLGTIVGITSDMPGVCPRLVVMDQP